MNRLVQIDGCIDAACERHGDTDAGLPRFAAVPAFVQVFVQRLCHAIGGLFSRDVESTEESGKRRRFFRERPCDPVPRSGSGHDSISIPADLKAELVKLSQESPLSWGWETPSKIAQLAIRDFIERQALYRDLLTW